MDISTSFGNGYSTEFEERDSPLLDFYWDITSSSDSSLSTPSTPQTPASLLWMDEVKLVNDNSASDMSPFRQSQYIDEPSRQPPAASPSRPSITDAGPLLFQTVYASPLGIPDMLPPAALSTADPSTANFTRAVTYEGVNSTHLHPHHSSRNLPRTPPNRAQTAPRALLSSNSRSAIAVPHPSFSMPRPSSSSSVPMIYAPVPMQTDRSLTPSIDSSRPQASSHLNWGSNLGFECAACDMASMTDMNIFGLFNEQNVDPFAMQTAPSTMPDGHAANIQDMQFLHTLYPNNGMSAPHEPISTRQCTHDASAPGSTSHEHASPVSGQPQNRHGTVSQLNTKGLFTPDVLQSGFPGEWGSGMCLPSTFSSRLQADMAYARSFPVVSKACAPRTPTFSISFRLWSTYVFSRHVTKYTSHRSHIRLAL